MDSNTITDDDTEGIARLTSSDSEAELDNNLTGQNRKEKVDNKTITPFTIAKERLRTSAGKQCNKSLFLLNLKYGGPITCLIIGIHFSSGTSKLNVPALAVKPCWICNKHMQADAKCVKCTNFVHDKVPCSLVHIETGFQDRICNTCCGSF